MKKQSKKTAQKTQKSAKSTKQNKTQKTQSAAKRVYSYADTIASIETVQKKLSNFDLKTEGWILGATLVDVRRHDSELDELQRTLDYLYEQLWRYRDAIRTRERAASFQESLNARFLPLKKRAVKLLERLIMKIAP